MSNWNTYLLGDRSIIRSSGLVCLYTLLLFISISLKAQNTMSIPDLEGSTSSEVILPIFINNQDAFVSFQLDLEIPANFQYVEGSIELSERSVDHVISVTPLEESVLRILSYSMSNQVFLDHEGEMAHLKLSTISQQGVYPLIISNAIIGNENSVNILDSISNGSIFLNANAINKVPSTDHWIQCYPNPFNDQIQIHFQHNILSEVQLGIYTVSMEKLAQVTFHPNIDRNPIIDFRSLINNIDYWSEGIYFLQFQYKDHCITKKLIRLNQ